MQRFSSHPVSFPSPFEGECNGGSNAGGQTCRRLGGVLVRTPIGRLFALWWIATIAMLLLGACSRAPAVPVDVAHSTPELEACALPEDSVRYIIVLDHSGSMRPEWQAVRRQLPAILDAIPDGGRLHLELFSGRIVTPINNSAIDATTRPDLRSQLANVPEPQRGARTDIGLALESAADAIVQGRAAGYGRVTFLFVITDGEHYPPATSVYNRPDAIEALRLRWSTLADDSRTELYTYAIPIGSEGLAGADWVANIVPQTIRIPEEPVARIGAILAHELGKASKDLLRFRVMHDVETPRLTGQFSESLQPLWFFGSTPAEVTLQSEASCVTYRYLASGTAESNGLLLPPGATGSTAIALSSRERWRERLPWMPPVVDTFHAGAPFLLQAQIDLEPASQLLALGINPNPPAATVAILGTIEHRPIGWWIVYVPGLFLLSVVLAFWWRGRAPQVGELVPTTKLDPSLASVPLHPATKYEGLLLPNFPGGPPVRIRLHKSAPWASPRHAQMTVEAHGNHPSSSAVAIAEENDDLTYTVVPLDASNPSVTVRRQSFILWQSSTAAFARAVLSEGEAQTHHGYRWTPPGS